jgi:Tol biopolymer transport system component
MKYTIRLFSVIAILSSAPLVFSQTKQNVSTDAMVFERFDNGWYEGLYAPVTISPDGSWALFGHGLGSTTHLYSLVSGLEENAALMGNLSDLDDATFCGLGSPAIARHRSLGSKDEWFLPGSETSQLSTLAARSLVSCSRDGSVAVYSGLQTSKSEMTVVEHGMYRNYKLDGELTAAAFSSDGAKLYYLTFGANGESSLSRMQVHTGDSRTIATHLDASQLGGSIALSPDGKYVYLALASDRAPNNELRHKPNVDRWLKIYKMDLATGSLRLIVDSPGEDNTGPAIANGNLYWTRSSFHDSIVTFPLEGGRVKEVIAGGTLPMWNPNSSKIAYFFGGMRMADIGLNLDAGILSVDAEGNPTSKPSVIISGYHEDFPPAWSPDGKWLAFHSHRSATPVPTYSSAGSADDIFLRKADDLHAPEIRLTDFGEETGSAYWSPDGQKLLFNSYKPGGVPGIEKLFVITVDTQKGVASKTEMLQLPEEIRSVSWAAWSPDGKEIAIEDDRGDGKRILWIVRADGSQPEKILDYEGTTYAGLDWTRDGKSIIYSGLAGDRLQIFSIPRSGGTPRQLTYDSGNLMHPQVSPNGKRIACTRIVQSKQIWRHPIF